MSIREKIRGAAADFQTTQAGPLVDAGAFLLRRSQQRDTPADERKARGRERAGRVLLALGVYSFMREMFAAAESYGYASGRRTADINERADAFHAGRHAGWTEASVHWGLGLPAGIEPYRDGAENAFPWPGRVGLDGIPLDPFAEPPVDQGHAEQGEPDGPRRGWLVDERRQADESEPETVLVDQADETGSGD